MPSELSPTEAAALLRPTDSVGVPLGPGQPVDLLHAIGARDDWVQLDMHTAMLVDLYEFPMRSGVRTYSVFMGPAERLARDSGANLQFIPADYRRWGPLLAAYQPRVMCTAATPPDADGFVNLSLHSGHTVAELHAAAADPERLVMVQCSEHFPTTFGYGPDTHRLHIDDIDVLIPSERTPIELVLPEPDDAARAIAHIAAGYVRSGSTLQTGFGTIPSTIASLLADAAVEELGVHSEMFTSGLMKLHQAGKVTNTRKGIHDGVSICTFAAGTPELYEWLDGNPEVAFQPVDLVNAPHTIAAHHDMVTINGAIAVDLFGQVVADTIDGVQFSGIGGHADFVSGGSMQSDDHSLVCLPATTVVGGTLRSRIVAELSQGSVVTTPRHSVDVVVTEFGAAELRGKTVRERAQALAEVAHPDFRDELRAAAAAH
jgi:acyl-CoA hydrolase